MQTTKSSIIMAKIKINKQRRIIWTNDDYDEWCEAMADEIAEEEITPELFSDEHSIWLDDERCNLDIEVDGWIVAFAVLGLWDGKHNASKLVGDNIKCILHSDEEYVTWYCDPYNVRGEMKHHDGTNHVLYRVAKDRKQAMKLVNEIADGNMSEEQFRKKTRSLRPYVAKVYGW